MDSIGGRRKFDRFIASLATMLDGRYSPCCFFLIQIMGHVGDDSDGNVASIYVERLPGIKHSSVLTPTAKFIAVVDDTISYTER